MTLYAYVLICMTVYGCIWLCIIMYDMYDYIWLYLTKYDFVWLPMTMPLYHSLYIPLNSSDYVLCMPLYHAWLCVTINDFVWLFDSVRPYITMYNFVWLYMTMYDFLLIFFAFPGPVYYAVWLCVTLDDSFGMSFTNINFFDFIRLYLTLSFSVWLFWFCLSMFDLEWLCLVF